MRTNARDCYRLLLAGALALLLVGCSSHGGKDAPVTEAAPAEKIKIQALDDLPAHSYPLDGTVTELLESPQRMEALRKSLRADIESDLATYEITDDATLQGMYQNLAMLDMADRNFDGALQNLDKVAALEDKEASRLMSGLTSRAYIAAKGKVPGNATAEEFANSFRQELKAYVDALPYDVVQDQIKSGKARAEYMNENLLMGMVQAQMEPAAQAMGELSGDLAAGLVGIRYAIDERLALNPVIASVYGEYLAANEVAKKDIWPERDVTLAADLGYAPVVIGIWDSGVDAGVFGGRMFVNGAEKIDGADTDGNGFVDDVHGIAFNLDGVATPEMLHPLGDQNGKLDAVFQYMQGFVDMTSAVDSDAATAVRTRMANIPPGEVGDFMTTLSFGGLYMHGTHVAGIAVAGNPFARILNARITFDYHMTPKAMTMETARRLADAYPATTKYFRDHGVRVVNMSWGWTFKEIEGSLEANGVGDSAEERAKMARAMIDVISAGLKKAMTDAPDILFVTAAGNDDNDVEFDVVIPSSFDLPNLMVVGALDQAGDPTSFTSGGRNVRVYANGFQVESTIPGGQTMKMSGTSMASPNVCNLAAKLITVDPTLTPTQVKEMIVKGADAHPDHPEILRINPKNTLQLN
jgi:subtilisin family serine protease